MLYGGAGDDQMSATSEPPSAAQGVKEIHVGDCNDLFTGSDTGPPNRVNLRVTRLAAG